MSATEISPNKIPMVIDFSADGSVECMHRESVMDISFLGNQEIHRASDIRFCSETQTWGIWPSSAPDVFHAPYPAAKGFATYEGARNVEIGWFEKCRFMGVHPLTPDGELVLKAYLATVTALPHP